MIRATVIRFPAGAVMGVFLFSAASSPPLGPTQPPIRWVVKWPGREADLSPPSNAEILGTISSLPQYVFSTWCLMKQEICLHGLVLSEAQGQVASVYLTPLCAVCIV